MLMRWLQDRPRMIASMLILTALSVAWIGLSAVPASGTTSGLIPSPRQGFAAPDFTLERLDGQPITLTDLRGTVVILNLWTSWCPPCRAEMPTLQRIYEASQESGLEVLAINVTSQDSEADARSFVDENGLTFPVLLDRSGTVARLYQMRALPTTFFIDQQGVIRKVVIGGPMSEATIQTSFLPLLEEPR